MIDTVDALTSPTLKHLREHWWDDAFTEFLAETLRPRPGNRILDVGCGEGLAEVAIGRLQVSQVRLVRRRSGAGQGRCGQARRRVAQSARQLRRRRRRPAALQGRELRLHFLRGRAAARRPRGRGRRRDRARHRSRRAGRDRRARQRRPLYLQLAAVWRARVRRRRGLLRRPGRGSRRRHRSVDRSRRCRRCWPTPASSRWTVRLFPVSHVQLGCPRDEVWTARRARVEQALSSSPAPEVRASGEAYLRALDGLPRRITGGGRTLRRDPAHDAVCHRWPKGRVTGAPGSRLPASGSPRPRPEPAARVAAVEGHDGWDDYAPFYDWENARTLGRRDLPFWRTVARQVGGPVLELGCGTGRLSIPLARAGVPIVGIDRSEPMLGARPAPRVARRTASAPAAHPRRHPVSSVRGRRPAALAVRHGAGAVRHAAVAAARARPDGHPGRRASRPRAGRHAGHRAGGRPAVVGRVQEARQPVGLARPHGRVTRVAGGERSSGSRAAADDLRSGVHRNARPIEGACAPSRSPSARCRCRRWYAGSRSPASRSRRCSGTTKGARGMRAPTSG